MQRNKGQSSWISLSDVMTGLMLVFLLLVVITQYSTLIRYENTKREIFEALNNEFVDELEKGKVTIREKDLIVRFQETEALFEQDQAILLPRFKKVLADFIPKYIQILQDERWKNHIREIRIEGHTGTPTPLHSDYIALVALSQNRARTILHYLISSKSFLDLPLGDKKNLRFKLMANGFGNGRMVDENGKYIKGSDRNPSADTRRVEFRIMTDAEKRLEEALGQL